MLEEPTVYTAHQLRAIFTNNTQNQTLVAVQPGNHAVWIPARSLTMQRFVLWKRLKLALSVFLGRADVVYWDRIFPDGEERFK